MLLSAVSVLVVAQSSSEILEGLMNNPVYSLLQFSVALNFACVISLQIALNLYSIYHCANVIYVYPYHNSECVPKSNSKFIFCFNALSEIRITLQIIFTLSKM